MARRALPALLALIAFVADLSGSHGVALVFVLAAIPAALRSPAVVGGVPHLAVSAVVLALLLYGGALVGALLASPRPTRFVVEEPEPERLAA
jgi:hypothetical protein